MKVWDVVDYVVIGVWLAYLGWFWWTMGTEVLNPGYPPQRAARRSVRVVLVALVLGALSAWILSAQGAAN